MADETISTKIVANADFSALIADVHKVTASLSKLQEQLANSNKMMANQIAVMNRSFSDTLRSTGQFSTHFVSLQSDVEKFGKNLDGGKLKLNQYFNTFRQHAQTSGGLIRDLAKQQVALQNSILQPLGRNAQGLMQFNVHVPRGLDEVKNKAALARQELQIMNKVLQDGAGQLINWGKNTQWAGRQLTVGLTVPLAAFGAQAAKAFREADQELVRLTKVYGDVSGTSAAELGRVRSEVSATAKELSSALGVNFKETIGLAADIAATGKTGNELLGSVKETTRLAVLGEVDRQDAMKATLAIQSAFKQNTTQLAESINFLNAVENQTSTSLGDLIEAIPKAGPVVQGLGGSIQDLALYLTAMKEGGINAAEGANALKSALASLINPTDVAVGKFKDLGIDLLGIVNNNAGNLTGTLLALQGALDNLDPLQKQQAIEQLFGKFQFSRLNALFENLGKQGSQTLKVLDLMKTSSQDLANVAGRELSQVTESASGKYRRALESLKADLAGIGEQFLTLNTALIQVVDKVVQFANNLPKPVKQILALVGGLTAVIGPVIMLTGVLANFFGYLLKGAAHMKAFFKGGEGWKYLTPEMLAAEKAGKLVEQSFYSDAKAAAVLQQALRNLLDEFAMLEAKAKSGAMAVNPAVSTMAGNLVMGVGGQRVVNKDHPLVGDYGTRASSHMVSRVGRDPASQTMFGMVPGAIPVNAAIGQNPQIYMNEPLPNVPGLTTVKGVSTGIVSGEAARWHAMMATLGMQSKAEIEMLKKTIAATGTVSKEFMMQFDDILPVVSNLTDNAARESAMIVAELRAGKLTVEAARAKIVALNLQTEQMIASSVSATAASMGRTINPTMVPTLNQPVVDATGKSNMRELFKKGKTKDFINKIAGVLGVRTSGAGYNIETTIPKKFNNGGYVFTANQGNVVPGPNVNADVVPAMLTPGEFVVNREAAQANLPLLSAINGGSGNNGPRYGTGGVIAAAARRIVPTGVLKSLFQGRFKPGLSKTEYEVKGTQGVFGSSFTNPLVAKAYNKMLSARGRKPIAGNTISRQKINAEMKYGPGVPPDALLLSMMSGTGRHRTSADVLLQSLVKAGKITPDQASKLSDKIFEEYAQELTKFDLINDSNNPIYAVTNRVLSRESASIREAWTKFSSTPGMLADKSSRGSSSFLDSLTLSDGTELSFDRLRGEAGSEETFFHAAMPEPLSSTLSSAGYNTGGMVRGYNRGGMVKGYSNGGMIPSQNGQKYNTGGMVRGYNRGGFIKGLLGSAAIYGGGQMLGNQIGGGLGSAISMGSSILSSMVGFGGLGGGKPGMGVRMASKLPQGVQDLAKSATTTFGPFEKAATKLRAFSGGLTGITKAIGPLIRGFAGILRMATPLGAALTALTIGTKIFIDIQKAKAKALETGRLAFGMDADAAEKAGLKYTSYNDKMKQAITNAQDLKERNLMIYESMTKANVPMNMTIEQYKKLKEEVKKTMGSYVDLFNQIERRDVKSVAIQLKAQFMAAGDTAEEATAKIFTMIKMSEKANLAGGAIGTKAFQSIQTLEDAAKQTAKTFESAMQTGDAESKARALHDAFQAMDGTLAEIIKKNSQVGDSSAKSAETTGAAIKETIDKMNGSYTTQSKLTKDIINEIGKTDHELANVLNNTDSLTSAWAKYQLVVAGVALNVKSLSGEAAIAAVSLNSIIASQIQQNNEVVKINKTYTGMTDKIKALETAAKGQSAKSQIDSRKVVEGLNKRIEAIRKEAKEKVDGIRKQTDAENAQLEIQKAQLRAQQALATGNMTSYAEEQLSIEQLLNEKNRAAAEEAIVAKAELDIKPLQDQIDKLSKKNQDLADKASIAGESLSNLKTRAAEYNTSMTSYTSQLQTLLFNLKTIPQFDKTPEYQNTLAALGKLGTSLGITSKPEDIVQALKNGLNNVKEVTILAEKVSQGKFADYTNNAAAFSAALVKGGQSGDVNKAYSGGILTNDAKGAIIAADGLEVGDQFTDTYGRKYKVEKGKFGFGKQAVAQKFEGVIPSQMSARRALGGRVVPGVPYALNDGGKVEGIKFDTAGMVYPNAATMPKFNIPSQTKFNGVNISNSPNSNNLYNIDINLNGTNVTADDVMRKFKQELALINAKEGPSRYVGGQV